VHVTDVATGRDRVLNLPTGNWGCSPSPPRGCMSTPHIPKWRAPGLWLVHPDSGARQTIFSDSAVHRCQVRVGVDRRSQQCRHAGRGHRAWGVGEQRNQGRDVNHRGDDNLDVSTRSDLYVGAAATETIVVSGRDLTSSYLWVLTSPASPTGDRPGRTTPCLHERGGRRREWLVARQPRRHLFWTPRAGAMLVFRVAGRPCGLSALRSRCARVEFESQQSSIRLRGGVRSRRGSWASGLRAESPSVTAQRFTNAKNNTAFASLRKQ